MSNQALSILAAVLAVVAVVWLLKIMFSDKPNQPDWNGVDPLVQANRALESRPRLKPYPTKSAWPSADAISAQKFDEPTN